MPVHFHRPSTDERLTTDGFNTVAAQFLKQVVFHLLCAVVSDMTENIHAAGVPY